MTSREGQANNSISCGVVGINKAAPSLFKVQKEYTMPIKVDKKYRDYF
jgi:hypothetical protein